MDDDFRITAMPMVFAGALIATPFITIAFGSTEWHALGIVIHSIVGIGFVVAALFEVLRGWRQDLIESRRRLRLLLIVVAGTYSVVIMTVELYLRNHPATEVLQLLNAGMLSVLLLGLALSLVSMSGSFEAALGWEAPPRETKPSGVDVIQPTPRDADGELIAKLQAAMTNKAMYRDAALSLTQLANAVGVPERRLREIVHTRLGHKNFASYVNAFRLQEVRLRLGDPREDALPILSIALDAGFGSIVAFNRAFKNEHGITPSVFRSEKRESVDRVESVTTN